VISAGAACRFSPLLLPEGSADGLRQLAREFRARHRRGLSGGGWRRLSPSADLMVDPRSGARCAIRDTRAAGDERYYWTVTVIGEPDPVAAGRTGDVGVARSLVELALGAYVANRSELSSTDDLGPSFPPKRFANALAASSSMNSTERTTSTPS
jgi:hypothetical protein